MSRLHYYISSDIPGKIRKAFKNRINKGNLIIEIPLDLSELATIQTFEDVVPSKIIKDLRSPKRKKDDLKGVSLTTFKKDIGIYESKQSILFSAAMGGDTQPSIHHFKAGEKIILIFRDNEENNIVRLVVYSDKLPFNRSQKDIRCEGSLTWATFAFDRRSTENQEENKFVIAGLSD